GRNDLRGGPLHASATEPRVLARCGLRLARHAMPLRDVRAEGLMSPRVRTLPAFALVGLAGIAAGRNQTPPTTGTIHASPFAHVDLAAAVASTRGNPKITRRSATSEIDVQWNAEDAPRLTVTVPGACPLEISAATPRIEIHPWIDLGGDRPQVGFDAP